MEVLPPVALPKPGTDSMDHAFAIGWSRDGAEFGYCMTDGGLGATKCQFRTPGGKLELLRDHTPGSEDIDPAKTKAIRERIQQRGYAVTAPAWPFARDLVVAWGVQKPETKKAPSLSVGAKLREATPPTVSLVLAPPSQDPVMPWSDIHPEAIALSPDGKHLGVVSHAFKGEFSDTFEVEIISSAVVAGQAYNDAGLALHRKKRFAEAAPLFHKAAYSNPESKVAMYNLACALAQLDDPGARAALELAIERGGEATKQKARNDEDFSRVREAPWFKALAAP